MFQVNVAARALSPFVELVGAVRVEAVARTAERMRDRLGSHTVWNINSTAAGGGVAEILRSQVRYSRGLGLPMSWLVIEGPPEFFAVTKRLHNALHDNVGDGSPLGPEQAAIYERVLESNFRVLQCLLRPGDAVICHDPQTAGLVPHLLRLGMRVIWRCHIGHEGGGRELDVGWSFLRRYLEDVPLAVFSRSAHVPVWMRSAHTVTIPPNIDPFSVKNEWMSQRSVRGILAKTGIIESRDDVGCAIYVDEAGVAREVARAANVLREGEPPAWNTPLIVQVSRWDRMKDHLGVLGAFARWIELFGNDRAALVLAGPSAPDVADDPEAPDVLRAIERAWSVLPESVRRRAQIVELPMADNVENAAMVNALQRHAAVIVQKSLREGFGLTVTEAMWKRRPIVASEVGGIQDQIRDGVEGLLVHDPTSSDETARALNRLLASPELGRQLGDAAHDRVTSEYLSIASLERWGQLIELLYS